MNTREFFAKILPAEGHGHHIVVCRKPYPNGETDRRGRVKTFVITRACNTFAEMAQQVKAWNKEGFDAYHACASFKKINWETKVARKSKRQYKAIVDTRTQDNAAFTRAQWLDVDVGPGKDYETRKEALTAIEAVSRVLGIPQPMIVSSGRTGLHCYWPFTQDVPAEKAALLMGSFFLALEEQQFNHDPSRTTDTASILRPIGTHNHKSKKAYPVELLQDADPVSPKKFYAPFKHLLGKAKQLRTAGGPSEGDLFDELNEQIKAGARPVTTLPAGDWEDIDPNTLFAPYSFKRLAPECGVAKMFVKQRPGMERILEPVWRGLLGLIKTSDEGEKLAHGLSKRSDSDYDKDETDYYLERWQFGPTTCNYFQQQGCEQCETCPHAGKITSPKTLGEEPVNLVDEEPETQVAENVSSTDKQVGVVEDIYTYSCLHPSERTLPYWNTEQYLAHKSAGVMKRHATDQEKKEKKPDWITFSNTIYYPFYRYYDWVEQKYMVKVCAQTGDAKDKKAWRIFDMDAAVTNDGNQLAKALAAQGINFMGGSKTTNLAFVQDMLGGLKEAGLETNSYASFGWHDDGFVLGNTYLNGKDERPVFVDKGVPDQLRGSFGLKGSFEGWVDQVDFVYNRPGAEPYQFLILSALASPLVSLSNPGGMWHGVVVALTGAGGLGKTTGCKVAASVYGDPSLTTIQANEEGTTLNALVQRVGTMRHLPLIMDEITGRKLEDIQSMLYSITSGKPKARCEQNGSERTTNLEWAMIPFVTGNVNITNMLANAEKAKQAATQVRCFEIRLPADFNKRVFAGLNGKREIEHLLLGEHHGHVGRKFLQYVTRNKDTVQAALLKVRTQLFEKYNVDPAERFYFDLVANAVVGGQIAKKLGIIKFDVKVVRDWAIEHIERLRGERAEYVQGTMDLLQQMLADMQRRTVVTQYWTPGRSERREEPNDADKLWNPCARRATKDQRYIIARSAVSKWCYDNHINTAEFLDELRKDSVLKPATGSGKASLFSGLSESMGLGTKQVRVWEFNYEAVASVADRAAGVVRQLHNN